MNDTEKLRRLEAELESSNKELQAERELRLHYQVSQDLSLSLDELPIGIYKTTLDGKIIFANATLLNITGFDSIDDLRGANARDFYVFPELRRIQTSGFVANDLVIDEYQFLRKDKSIIWVRDIGKKVVDENGAVTYEGSIEDITERKKAETQLIESETKYRNLIETMEQGLALHEIILDEDGEPCDYIFLDINSSFEDLTGLLKKDIIGKRVLEVLPETESYWINTYGKVALTGETVHFVNYSQELEKYYEVTAYRPAKMQFAVVILDVTEKVLTENALRDSELKLRTLINSVPDIICFKDGNGRWIEANDFDLNLFELEGVDYKGMTDSELADYSPFYREAFLACEDSDEIAWKKKVPSRSDEVIPIPDGEDKIFDIIKVPIFEPDGDRKGLVVVGREITEQKKLEEALRKSEALYRTLMDTSPDCITVANRMGKLTYISPQALNIYGLDSFEQAIGKSIFHYIALSDIPKAKDAMRRLNKGEQVVRDEFLLRKQDGAEFLGEVSSSILRDDLGEPIGMISVTRDITDRKNAEMALQEREFHYRIISEMITDYVYSCRLFPSGEVKLDWILGGIEKITGYSYEEVYNLEGGFASIIVPEDVEIFFKEHFPNILEIRDVQAEYRIYHKSGEIRWISDSIKPYKKEDSPNIIFQVGAVRDITDRKSYENTLLENSKELKLLNDQKDRFFSIIAHDLKSPLSSFLGLTKMLSEQLQEMTISELQEYTTNMLKSAGNIYDLLENLLEWSRMQRGTKQFNPDKIDLKYIIDFNIDFISNAFRVKNISINLKHFENIHIYGDVQMINTVIRNLLTNALKFTPRGGKVFIAVDNEGEMIKISVSDTGIGMDGDSIAKLFDIGQKISRPGTEDEPSSGLGLLLCKEFIDLHKGQIWVESSLGEGSTFNFTVPVAK